VTRQTVIAYWLIPSEPARSFFQKIINDLARRYDAPVFQPHVTIHVGADQTDAVESAITEATRGIKLISLTPIGVDHSDEFIKTLFVQFITTAELQQANELVREAANDSSRYELKPHLSLLYKNLGVATRRELATSIAVPFSDISFDSLQAIRCVSPTQTSADVKAWELIATTTFS
jgi:2'-5' RNA ligase